MYHGRIVWGSVKPISRSLSAVRATANITSASPVCTESRASLQLSFGAETNSAPVIICTICMYPADRPATSPSASNSIGGQSGSYATLTVGSLLSHARSAAVRSSSTSMDGPPSGTAAGIDDAAIISADGLAMTASLSMRSLSMSATAAIAFSMIGATTGLVSEYATPTSIECPISPALYRPSMPASLAL